MSANNDIVRDEPGSISPSLLLSIIVVLDVVAAVVVAFLFSPPGLFWRSFVSSLAFFLQFSGLLLLLVVALRVVSRVISRVLAFARRQRANGVARRGP